jgi:uncharacterized RDD family membrane protein YckC
VSQLLNLALLAFVRFRRIDRQRICGLRLVREIDGMPIDAGMAIVRFIVVIVEVIGCFLLIGILGFIWPAFESRKRAWHDIAAGTLLLHAQLYRR